MQHMEDFIKYVFQNNGITPPEECKEGLTKNFEGAINIEWFKKDQDYEAIFYKENSEFIALFHSDGNLAEYKQYLSVSYLPETIKNFLESKGEIMNIVLINKGNRIEYEAIVRDSSLVRFLVILSTYGDIIEERKL